MSRLDASVLIVGGGPVGMAMALSLGRAGVRSIVIERRTKVCEQARAAAILPRTLEILASWGVLDAFDRQGLRQQHLDVWPMGASKPALHLDLGELPTAYAYLLLLPQSQTEAILERAAVATGLVQVRRGHALVRLQQDRERVRLKVEDLVRQKTYHLYSRYAVGCDGYKSLVRKNLGIHMPGKTYAMRIAIADVQVQGSHAALPWPRLAHEPRAVHGALRLRDDLWRLVTTVPPKITEARALDPALNLERMQALIAEPVQNLRLVWQSLFNIHCRTASSFRRGRVFLAGDAAHVNSPMGGQGMNAGLADVHNLAWKLSRALFQGGQVGSLLSSYELERRDAVTRQVQPLTDRLTRLLSLRLPAVLTRAMWRGLAWLLQQPPVRRRVLPMFAMLNTRYRRSPLLGASHPLLGCRAPDAPLTDVAGHTASFCERQEGAALLLFEGETKSRAASLLTAAAIAVKGVTFYRILRAERPALTAAALSDSTQLYWRRWRAHAGMVALIRPDGHVGFVAAQAPGSVDAACAMVRRGLGIQAVKFGRSRPQRHSLVRQAPGSPIPAAWFNDPARNGSDR